MILRVRVLTAVAAFAFVLAGGERGLGLPSLPGVPGVPPVPSANQAVKGAISNELVKEFGSWFNVNRPVYVSGNDVLRTVPTLPGGPYHPASQSVTQKLFLQARNGMVQLPPGDYNVSVVTYCMGEHAQGPWRNKFLLAPIKGAWSDVVVALNFRASGSRFSPPQVQTLSWALQAGMGYAEMSTDSKRVVDALLPDFKPRLQGDFYDRAHDEWNSISSKVPGAPDFEAALTQLGDVGKSILQIRQARDEIIANANDFNSLVAQFTRLGAGRVADVVAVTPWSIVEPGVYARLRTRGTLLTPGVVQIRVTTQAASQRFEIASTHLEGLGNKVAFDPGFPFTNWAGFLNGLMQPLSWTPEPGSAPDPNQSGGGPDGGTPPGSGGGGGGGNNGSNNGGNGGNNGNNDGGNAGGGGGGGSNPNGGGNENNGNDFDTSTPCDPPGNVFGVVNGTVVASSSTMLVLGRGADPKKSTGVLCLLLRPYVSMAPLGWPDRGTGSVDEGSVSYNLPGHSGPGHVVVFAHYTYATTSTLTNPYVKKQVTAVIDYAGVSPFCQELQQTLTSHGSTQSANWLSGAELENRLCIAGMLGQTISVRTWVVDGDAVNASSLNHPVSPENFLYSDSWNHM